MSFNNFDVSSKVLAVSVGVTNVAGGAVKIGDMALAGIIVPAGMVSTSITFQVSVDGENFYVLKDDLGSVITVVLTSGSTGGFYSLRRVLPLGVGYVNPISSAAETGKTVTLIGQKVA